MGTVRSGPDSNINFEVWIPTDGNWNGKYEQVYVADAIFRG